MFSQCRHDTSRFFAGQADTACTKREAKREVFGEQQMGGKLCVVMGGGRVRWAGMNVRQAFSCTEKGEAKPSPIGLQKD